MNVVPLRAVEAGTLIDGYVMYLVGEGLAPRTVKIYTRLLERAFEFLRDERGVTLEDCGPLDVVALSEIVPASRSAKIQLRSVLRHYWEWTGRDRTPIKAIRVPAKSAPATKALSDDEAMRLVVAAKQWHPGGTATLLGLYLGLRVSEIAEARWDRFDQGLAWYTVKNVKGGALDRLPVHVVLREHLSRVQDLQRMIREPESSFIFPGSRGRDHVTQATVWGWTKELAEEVGIEGFHTHRLRHTCLSVANDNSGDLRSVSMFARHRQIQTTMGYTRTTDEKLEAVMEALSFGD